MTTDDIIAKLKDTMRETATVQADWDAVSVGSTIDSLGFDSLTILDLLYDIQQVFGVDFEAEELVGIATVGDLVRFLESRGV